MCNIVEKLIMLKIDPLNLSNFPKSGSGIQNPANLTSGTSLLSISVRIDLHVWTVMITNVS